MGLLCLFVCLFVVGLCSVVRLLVGLGTDYLVQYRYGATWRRERSPGTVPGGHLEEITPVPWGHLEEREIAEEREQRSPRPRYGATWRRERSPGTVPGGHLEEITSVPWGHLEEREIACCPQFCTGTDSTSSHSPYRITFFLPSITADCPAQITLESWMRSMIVRELHGNGSYCFLGTVSKQKACFLVKNKKCTTGDCGTRVVCSILQ